MRVWYKACTKPYKLHGVAQEVLCSDYKFTVADWFCHLLSRTTYMFWLVIVHAGYKKLICVSLFCQPHPPLPVTGRQASVAPVTTIESQCRCRAHFHIIYILKSRGSKNVLSCRAIILSPQVRLDHLSKNEVARLRGHLWSVGADQPPLGLTPPTPFQSVYREDCTQCFDSIVSSCIRVFGPWC